MDKARGPHGVAQRGLSDLCRPGLLPTRERKGSSHPLEWRKDRRTSRFKMPPNLNQAARIGASEKPIFGIGLEPQE